MLDITHFHSATVISNDEQEYAVITKEKERYRATLYPTPDDYISRINDQVIAICDSFNVALNSAVQKLEGRTRNGENLQRSNPTPRRDMDHKLA